MNVKVERWMWAIPALLIPAGCAFQSGPEGNPALKVFGALGICLAAVFLIFYIVVKSRERD